MNAKIIYNLNHLTIANLLTIYVECMLNVQNGIITLNNDFRATFMIGH